MNENSKKVTEYANIAAAGGLTDSAVFYAAFGGQDYNSTGAQLAAYLAANPAIAGPLANALTIQVAAAASGATKIGNVAAGSGAVSMTVADRLDLQTVDILTRIPLTEWPAIFSRTSVFDCTPSLVAAVSTGKRVTCSLPGRYKFVTPYAGTTDFDVEALCEGVEFDLTAIASGTCIGNSGSLTQISNVNPGFTINQGRNLLTLASAPAVSVGDWICIYNPTDFSYSGWRNYYRAGEWKQVLSVSGNSITTTKPFYATYAAADVLVYRLNSVRSRLANVRLLGGAGNKQLVIFSQTAGAIFDRVSAEGSNYSAYGFDRCVRGVVYDPQIRNLGAGTDDYGVIASNSQHIKIHRGSIYARRHAVAQGGLDAIGGVPCRDIRTYDALLSNDPEQNVGAADFHGNVEQSSFERCTIYGAVKYGGGPNNYCIDCDIYAPGGEVQANAIGWCAYYAEVKGGRIGSINCRLYTTRDPQPSNQGIVSINGTGPSGVDGRTTLPFAPVLKGSSVYGRNLSSGTRLFLFINRGTTIQFNPEVDDIRLDVDALSDITYSSNSSFTATGSISGSIMTITAVANNSFGPGQILSGSGVTGGTVIGAQISGVPGGIGDYSVSPSQTVASTTITSIGVPSSSGIIVDHIYGAPTGSRLHNAAGSFYLNFPHRLQSQSGVWAGTTTVNTAVVSAPITFPLAYPKEPRFSYGIGGASGASFGGSIGGQVPQVSLFSRSGTAIRPQITAPANFTAGATFDLSWNVNFQDC